jgi:DNA-binding response OmpR family regulator
MKAQKRTTATKTNAAIILLVDDDPAIREMVGRVLSREGYVVLCAANGAEAVAITEINHVDLVMLDLNMPVQGGWDAFAQITSRDPLVAVIIITARSNQLFTALGAGVGALLEKPLDFPVLLKTVEALLEETSEKRLARLTGHHTEFRYLPSTGKEH